MATVSDIFHISSGSDLELVNIDATATGPYYPFVSRTSQNNGVSAFVPLQPSAKLNPGHALSVALGGSVLETFYQSSAFYSGFHIGILRPKQELSIEELLYYATCIRANRIKYSYGRQANRTLAFIEIPDLHDVREKIASIRMRTLSVAPSSNPCMDFKCNTPIALSDLFYVRKTGSKTLGELLRDDGTVPVVSSTEKNNGVCGYSNHPVEQPFLPCLTIAINGSVGA